MFIQSESSERIRRALRCKIQASEEKYEHGEGVYYKREGQETWLGPGKVVFQDGKVVFVRHGGVFVRVSPNRLVKSNPDFRRQVSNSSNTRGHEFTLPEQEPSKVDTVVEESLRGTNVHSLPDSPPAAIQENLTMPSTEPTSTQVPQKAFPKPGDVILFKPDCNDLWNKAQVIGRAGKASGKHKDWVNIKDKDDQNTSIDLSRVVCKSLQLIVLRKSILSMYQKQINLIHNVS